jgi:predicted phosphodiesterase
MKIAYCSDLHLDVSDYSLEPFKGGADVLVLAGDIVEFRNTQHYIDWFRKTCANYEHVIWCAGNHEWYRNYHESGVTLTRINDLLKNEGINNITATNRGIIDVRDFRFIIATLWTDLANGSPWEMYKISNGLNDFRKIRGIDGEGRRLSDSVFIHEHGKDKTFISEALCCAEGRKVCVVTHHCPDMCFSQYHTDLSHGYCCTDMQDVMVSNEQRISAWIFGHTHEQLSSDLLAYPVCTHARGYDLEHFEPNIIEIA